MSCDWEDCEPEPHYGTCEKCGEDFVWMLNQNSRWVPVETDSCEHEEQQYDSEAGHVLHFDVCQARKDPFKEIKPE